MDSMICARPGCAGIYCRDLPIAPSSLATREEIRALACAIIKGSIELSAAADPPAPLVPTIERLAALGLPRAEIESLALHAASPRPWDVWRPHDVRLECPYLLHYGRYLPRFPVAGWSGTFWLDLDETGNIVAVPMEAP